MFGFIKTHVCILGQLHSDENMKTLIKLSGLLRQCHSNITNDWNAQTDAKVF